MPLLLIFRIEMKQQLPVFRTTRFVFKNLSECIKGRKMDELHGQVNPDRVARATCFSLHQMSLALRHPLCARWRFLLGTRHYSLEM